MAGWLQALVVVAILGLFVTPATGVAIILVALTFLPALSLGPIDEGLG
jgi:K+-transporting ATPase A subunit